MSKVYIVSTHRFDGDPTATPGAPMAESFLPQYKRMIEDDDWERYFGVLRSVYDQFRFYYELPSSDDCRVYAVHDLPSGNCRLCTVWIDSLLAFFVNDIDDDICLILHDKDIVNQGIPNHYSFTHSRMSDGRRFRVFGFQHQNIDRIWRSIRMRYATALLFSNSVEPVLDVIMAKDILEYCQSHHTYPDRENDILSLFFSVERLREDYPDPLSPSYLIYLNEIKRKVLRMIRDI